MLRHPRILVLCALTLVACEDKPAPGPAGPDTPGTASAAAATSAAASAAAQSAAATSAAEAPTAQASATAAASGSAAAPMTQPAIKIPNPPNGVMAAGAADKILKTGSKPAVRLVEPGAEPRTPISYAFSKGPTKPLAVSLDMIMGLKAKAMELPATAVPRMTMTLDLTPAEKNAEGDWKVDAKLRDVTVDPKGDAQGKLAEALRPQLASLKGLTMAYWITPHGSVHGVKVDVPGGMPPEADKMMQSMNQSFESMVAPLPKEPVGPGAKWQVISRLNSQGADILQFATFTLRSREGTKVGVDVSLKQLAANEQIAPPGLPKGVTARVKSFNSGGDGKNTIDTRDVAPESGSLTVKSKMEIEVAGAGGTPESNAVDSNITVHFTRPQK